MKDKKQRDLFVRFEKKSQKQNKDPFLGMANWFSSDFHFPEKDAEAEAALNIDHMPFLVPQLTPSPGHEAASFHFNGYSFSSFPQCPWSMPVEGFVEGRVVSASRSHSEAEKRRRDRINAQLATLRKLIPESEKMDKAALLSSVVEHVKELKRNAIEINKVMMIPTDVDEVTIDYVHNNEKGSSSSTSSWQIKDQKIFLKASVCCEDRPGLFSELNRALKSLKVTIIHADMISLGGRIRSIFVLCAEDVVEGGVSNMNTLKQSLKVVLSRIATSNYRIRSRRQKFLS